MNNFEYLFDQNRYKNKYLCGSDSGSSSSSDSGSSSGSEDDMLPSTDELKPLIKNYLKTVDLKTVSTNSVLKEIAKQLAIDVKDLRPMKSQIKKIASNIHSELEQKIEKPETVLDTIEKSVETPNEDIVKTKTNINTNPPDNKKVRNPLIDDTSLEKKVSDILPSNSKICSNIDSELFDKNISNLDNIQVNQYLSPNKSDKGNIRMRLSYWVLPNKYGFSNFIHNNFTNSLDNYNSPVNTNTFEVEIHQKFVSQYLQNDSPYRGLLLYHGLGSGKTCASILTSNAIYNRKVCRNT